MKTLLAAAAIIAAGLLGGCALDQQQQSDMDPHDRAMLVAAYLSRPQPAPYNPWAFALQPHPSTNCLSNVSGTVISTTCQ